MNCRAFVSYSRKDGEFVKRLVEEVHSRLGIQVWYDLDGIETGDKFQDRIIGHIDECDVFIFVMSKNSLGSEWVRKEVTYADRKNKRMYPIAIDGTKPEGWFLFDFGDRDYIDYGSEDGRNRFYRDLERALGMSESHGSRGGFESTAHANPESSGGPDPSFSQRRNAEHKTTVDGHKARIAGGASRMAACADGIRLQYQAEGYQVQVLSFDDGGSKGALVQVRNVKESGAGKWIRRLTGLETCAMLKLLVADDDLTIEVMGGKWLDKVAVAAVSWFVLWPLLVTASVGAFRQKKQLDGLFVNALAFFSSNSGVH